MLPNLLLLVKTQTKPTRKKGDRLTRDSLTPPPGGVGVDRIKRSRVRMLVGFKQGVALIVCTQTIRVVQAPGGPLKVTRLLSKFGKTV